MNYCMWEKLSPCSDLLAALNRSLGDTDCEEGLQLVIFPLATFYSLAKLTVGSDSVV